MTIDMIVLAQIISMFYAIFSFGEARGVVLYGTENDREKFLNFMYKGTFFLVAVLDSLFLI